MAWTIVLLDEVEEWFLAMVEKDPHTAELVTAAVDLLEQEGPTLGRPAVDRLKGSKLHNLKELRPGSTGDSEVRMLFAFDPHRRAVILVAGDKSGAWNQWYRENIPVAEARYQRWLAGDYADERG